MESVETFVETFSTINVVKNPTPVYIAFALLPSCKFTIAFASLSVSQVVANFPASQASEH